MLKLKRIVLLIALSASLSGCEILFPTGHYELHWQELRRETFIDPTTGNITRTFYWRYDDGHLTTTTEVIPKGEGSDRRLDVRPTPPARFAD